MEEQHKASECPIAPAPSPRPFMYIFVNKGLGMSAGKLASQAAHAAVEGYIISKPELQESWRKELQYPKLVMQASNEQKLLSIQRYLEKRGIKSELIIDEGLTEIDSHVATALGVELVDKADESIVKIFEHFELYRDTIKVTFEMER